jgi:ketosteroid isomerase-like protein
VVSEENLRLVREGYEAWNRGDLDWLLEHISPDFEFHTAQLFPDTEAIYQGREGYKRFWETFHVPWENLSIEIERLEQVGENQVLALLRFIGRGREGVEASIEYANLLTIEEGLNTRVVGYAGWKQALEAVGLRS